MKIQLKNIGFSLLILMGSVLALSSCENEMYNEHYSIKPGMSSDQTLWESIKANPELTKFAWVLRKTGYDKVLSSSQMFTVWAPLNSEIDVDTIGAFISGLPFDSITMRRQFVENHVSRYSYSASSASDARIVLLNKKIARFKLQGGAFSFGDIPLIQKNLLSSNGILHVIGKRFDFFGNIWESMVGNTELDSVRTYLYSFNRIVFDPNKSISGGLNALGQTIYLDSVKYNYNKMFMRIGQVNSEDSSYIALLPTNTAWNKAYSEIKDYFKYTTFVVPSISTYTADTLQRNNTMLALVRDLVFSNKMQASPADSLISTTRSVFHSPASLFDGATKFTKSNGTVYITNELKSKHWESWNTKITVEAERTTGRKADYANVFERAFSESFPFVSGSRYLELVPTSAVGRPAVTLDIPNTLSGKLKPDMTRLYGASYNIYCVVLPATIKNATPRSNKLSFVLSYQNELGKVINTTFDNPLNKVPQYFVTAKDKITKVLLASNIAFPNCEFGLVAPTVKLKVISNALESESVTFSRELLIDCIILEPVQ